MLGCARACPARDGALTRVGFAPRHRCIGLHPTRSSSTQVVWRAQRGTDLGVAFDHGALVTTAISTFVGVTAGAIITLVSFVTIWPTSASDKALRRLASAAARSARVTEFAFGWQKRVHQHRARSVPTASIDLDAVYVFSKLDRCRQAIEVARRERLVGELPVVHERIWRPALPVPLIDPASPLPNLAEEARQALRRYWRTAAVMVANLNAVEGFITPELAELLKRRYRSPDGTPLLDVLDVSIPAAMNEAQRALESLARRGHRGGDGSSGREPGRGGGFALFRSRKVDASGCTDVMRTHIAAARHALLDMQSSWNEQQRIEDNIIYAQATRALCATRSAASHGEDELNHLDCPACGADDVTGGSANAHNDGGIHVVSDEAKNGYWPPPPIEQPPEPGSRSNGERSDGGGPRSAAQCYATPYWHRVMCETNLAMMQLTQSTWERHEKLLNFRMLIVLSCSLCDELERLRVAIADLVAWDAGEEARQDTQRMMACTDVHTGALAARHFDGHANGNGAFASGGYEAVPAKTSSPSSPRRAQLPQKTPSILSAERDLFGGRGYKSARRPRGPSALHAASLSASRSASNPQLSQLPLPDVEDGCEKETDDEGSPTPVSAPMSWHSARAMLLGASRAAKQALFSPASFGHFKQGLRPALAAIPLTAIGFWALDSASANAYQAALWSVITLGVLSPNQALASLALKAFERLVGTIAVGFLSGAIALLHNPYWFVAWQFLIIALATSVFRALEAPYAGVVSGFTHIVISFGAYTAGDSIELVSARIVGVSSGIVAILLAVLFVMQESSSQRALDLLHSVTRASLLCVAVSVDTCTGDDDGLASVAQRVESEAPVSRRVSGGREPPAAVKKAAAVPASPRWKSFLSMATAMQEAAQEDTTGAGGPSAGTGGAAQALDHAWDAYGGELFKAVRMFDAEVQMAGSERLACRCRGAGCGSGAGRGHAEPFYCPFLPYWGRMKMNEERSRGHDEHESSTIDLERAAAGSMHIPAHQPAPADSRARRRNRARGLFPVAEVWRVERRLLRCFRDSIVLVSVMGHTRLMAPEVEEALGMLYGDRRWMRALHDGIVGALVGIVTEVERVSQGGKSAGVDPSHAGDGEGDCVSCAAVREHLNSAWRSLEGVTAAHVHVLAELDALQHERSLEVLGRGKGGGAQGNDATNGDDAGDRAAEVASESASRASPALELDRHRRAAWFAVLRLIELSSSPADHHRRVLRSRAFIALMRRLLLDLGEFASAVEDLASAAP